MSPARTRRVGIRAVAAGLGLAGVVGCIAPVAPGASAPRAQLTATDCPTDTGTAADELRFTTPTLQVPEGGGERLVLVLRTGAGAGPVSALATTTNGTATAESDYAPVASTVTFADGDATVQLVRVPIVQDLVHEGDETLTVTLSDPACATLGNPSSVEITIVNDDPVSTFTVGGTVSGLEGTGLELRNTFDEEIEPANGPFTFPRGLPAGRNYQVDVRAQPSDPSQICTVANGSGTMPEADVTDVTVECVAPPAQAGLDPGFGTDGTVVTPGLSGAKAVAIQPDGMIVAAGQFALARYTADGSLDPAFGTNGTVRTGLGASFSDEASDVALQPDGSIVVVGVMTGATTREDFAAQRYDARGVLDPTFGTGGTVTTDFHGGTDRAYGVAIQPDGAIVVAGHAAEADLFGSDVAVARYTPAGVLDATFGTGGLVTTDVAGEADFGFALALQRDGAIVAAGRVSDDGGSGEQFGVVRYTATGALDPTFSDDGMTITAIGLGSIAHGVAVHAQDRILVAGYAQSGFTTGKADFALARLDPSGALDPSFGGDGVVTTDFADVPGPSSNDESAKDVVVQSDGRIVVVGTSGSDLAITRHESSGALDPSFGAGGRLTVDFHGGFDAGHDIAVQADGRIVAVGTATNVTSREFGLARVTP